MRKLTLEEYEKEPRGGWDNPEDAQTCDRCGWRRGSHNAKAPAAREGCPGFIEMPEDRRLYTPYQDVYPFVDVLAESK